MYSSVVSKFEFYFLSGIIYGRVLDSFEGGGGWMPLDDEQPMNKKGDISRKSRNVSLISRTYNTVHGADCRMAT